MRICFFLLCVAFGFLSWSQGDFRKGFYIDNQEDRNDCYILITSDFSSDLLKLRQNEKGKEESVSIKNIRSFQIPELELKYVRFNVPTNADPEDSKDRFLRVIIEGEASLYEHPGTTSRSFYLKKKEEIQLLRYSETKIESTLKRSTIFKNQLYASLKCPSISLQDVKDLKYLRPGIQSTVKKYNKCKGVEFTEYTGKKIQNTSASLDVIAKVGYGSPSLALTRGSATYDLLGTSFQVGMALKYPLFPKVILNGEILYNSISTDVEIFSGTLNAKYSRVEFLFGPDFQTWIGDNAKLSAGGGFFFYAFSSGLIELTPIPLFADFDDFNSVGGSFYFNVGFDLSRINLQYRRYPGHEIIENGVEYSSSLSINSFMIGYRIL